MYLDSAMTVMSSLIEVPTNIEYMNERKSRIWIATLTLILQYYVTVSAMLQFGFMVDGTHLHASGAESHYISGDHFLLTFMYNCNKQLIATLHLTVPTPGLVLSSAAADYTRRCNTVCTTPSAPPCASYSTSSPYVEHEFFLQRTIQALYLLTLFPSQHRRCHNTESHPKQNKKRPKKKNHDDMMETKRGHRGK